MKQTSRNNDSRKDCKWFCEAMDLEQIGNSNMFRYGTKIWCYSIPNESKTIRQFYDIANGIYVDGNFVERRDLKIGAVTRVSPNLGKARNAAYK